MKNTTVTHKFLGLLGLFLAGCASQPVGPLSTSSVNQWESKAQIVDRETQKSHNVSVDFVTAGEKRLRMQVTGTFATPLAVAVLNQEKLTYVLPRQKRFYEGVATPKSLKPLLNMDLEPSQIFRILYDEPLQGSAWRCQKNSQGLVAGCENTLTHTKVAWMSRDGEKKTVVVSGPRYDVQLRLERVPTKVRDAGRVFSLNVPAGFRDDAIR